MRSLAGTHLRAGGRDRRRRGVSAGDPGRRRVAARHAVGAGPAAGRAPTATRSTYQRALSLLGATDVALIDDAVDALAAGDAAALFGAVEAVIDAGHDPRRFATDLLERFRDLIVLQAVPDAAARGVVDAPEDVLERMREQATRIGTATLTRYAEVVHAGLGEMRGATAPRLLLEVVCARLLLPSASDTEVGAAAARRAHRDPAGHVDPGDGRTGRRRRRSSSSARPGAPSRRRRRRSQAGTAPRRRPRRRPGRRRHAPSRSPTPVPEPEARAGAGARARPADRRSPKPASTPAGASAGGPGGGSAPSRGRAGEPNAAAVRSMWTTVREKVRERSRTTE